MAQDDFWKYAKSEINKIARQKGISNQAAAKYLKRNLDSANAAINRPATETAKPGSPGPQGRSPMQGKGAGSGKKSPAVGIRDSIQGKAASKLSPTRKTGTTKFGAAKYETQSPRQANTMGTPSRRPQSQKADFKPKVAPGPTRPSYFGNAAYTKAQQAKSNANYSAKSVGPYKSDGTYSKGMKGGPSKSTAALAGISAAAARKAEEARKAQALKNKQTMILKSKSGSGYRRGAM